MVWLVIAVTAFFLFSILYLRGENLQYLDSNILPQAEGLPSEQHYEVVASLAQMAAMGGGASLGNKQGLSRLREYMDSMSDGKDFSSEFRFVAEGQLRGEWVIAPGVDTRRRVLYIHGGAWMMGSPKSHRAITDKLSQVANAAVFSLDYRLMPEHRRLEGVADCHKAYRWLLTNGPDGLTELDFLLVGGDSAGGNLALHTIAWARDEGLRAADAALAFSPATDVTMGAPSLRSNIATDPMLGPAFGKLAKVPAMLLLWMTWFTSRRKPCDPMLSPLRGDLSGLPPVLVQASEAEMLLDDARRYVTKAQNAGSPVELQTWPFMVHVWQIFVPELPEANEAFENIAEFLETVEETARLDKVA